MAEASTVHEERVEGARTVVLREPETGSEVRVVADVGSNVAAFRTRVGGRTVDVLSAPPDMATLRERPTRWGSAPLFPYPGRIENGRFSFLGREHTLPRDQRDGHAIHGFARGRAFRVLSTDAGAEGARVVTQIGTEQEAVPPEEWPFPCQLTLTTSLRGGVLRVEAEAENTGTEPMPMGLGFHPYFPVHDDCEVWVDATEEWEQTGPGLPTPRITPLGPEDGLRRPRRLADVPARVSQEGGSARNLLYRREGGGIRAGLRDRRNGVEVMLEASAEFPVLVLFTPPSPPVISLEPLTCVPNAFNLQPRGLPAGVVSLDPGQRWRGSFTVRASQL